MCVMKFNFWMHVFGMLALGGAVAACTTAGARLSNNPLDTIFEPTEEQVSGGTRPRKARNVWRHEDPAGMEVGEEEVYGTGQFLRASPKGKLNRVQETRDGVTINLRNVPIAEAAKSIFGDILGFNYIISPGVEGTVTIETTRPLPKQRLARIFANALRSRGYSVTYEDGVYVIGKADGGKGPVLVRGERGPVVGVRTWLVPLRHVSAEQMAALLRPFVKKGSIFVADKQRDILVVSGTTAELSGIDKMIRTFDVDSMRGMSFGLYPVRSKSPLAVVKELETVFGSAGTLVPDKIRFVPNQRMGAILVIARQPSLLRRAKNWIKRLDRFVQANEERVFIYKAENRSPKELAELLEKVLKSTGKAPPPSGSKPIAPRFANAGVTVGTDVEAGQEEGGKGDAEPPMTGPVTTTERDALSKAVIVADKMNKALLIRTTPRNYRRILNILYKIDVPVPQVMLEAVIAEVTLNDELRFGVKWFLQSGKHNFILSDLVSGAVKSTFPGFSYSFASSDIRFVLDALSDITDVNVISAPSLMVMDNEPAVLQIGDQVPIATKASQKPDDPDAPVVTTIEMKDTGVIFRVTPQVNENGQVFLQIDQEVSSAQKTTTSGIDSPTISKRRLSTKVLVNDGAVVALGGLIQQRDAITRKQIPVLGNIPVIGTVFRSKTSSIHRTELIIFLRPRVIRNKRDAQAVAQEFRRRLHVRPLQPVHEGDIYVRDVRRIFK